MQHCIQKWRTGLESRGQITPLIKNSINRFRRTEIGTKNETVSQDRNDESGLNPVEIYAEIVRRIRSYTNVSNNLPIFTLFYGSSFSKISGREILIYIWSSVDCIGEDSLGFTSADVGTHSVRASLAVVTFLTK